MGAVSTVGINNNFPSGKAAVTLRAANDKSTRWVDVVLGVFQELRRNSLFDAILNYVFLELFVSDVGTMLRGDNDGLNTGHFTRFVFRGYLALCVGAQEIYVFCAA